MINNENTLSNPLHAGITPKCVLSVGDLIEFDYFGQTKRGTITDVGKHGYWIYNTSGAVGIGYIRCDFDKARLVADR